MFITVTSFSFNIIGANKGFPDTSKLFFVDFEVILVEHISFISHTFYYFIDVSFFLSEVFDEIFSFGDLLDIIIVAAFNYFQNVVNFLANLYFTCLYLSLDLL